MRSAARRSASARGWLAGGVRTWRLRRIGMYGPTLVVSYSWVHYDSLDGQVAAPRLELSRSTPSAGSTLMPFTTTPLGPGTDSTALMFAWPPRTELTCTVALSANGSMTGITAVLAYSCSSPSSSTFWETTDTSTILVSAAGEKRVMTVSVALPGSRTPSDVSLTSASERSSPTATMEPDISYVAALGMKAATYRLARRSAGGGR